MPECLGAVSVNFMGRVALKDESLNFMGRVALKDESCWAAYRAMDMCRIVWYVCEATM